MQNNCYFLKEDKIFNDKEFENLLKNNTNIDELQIESYYLDLAIVDENNRSDNIKDKKHPPTIVFEFKYEPDKDRIDKDLRSNISLPKNDLKSIIYDIKIIEQLVKLNKVNTGYFVFIDEGNEFKNREKLDKYFSKRNKRDFLGNSGTIYIFKKCGENKM